MPLLICFVYFNMKNNSDTNKFHILCLQASESNWCWDIYCTTCGCLEIKAAFYAIGNNTEMSEANIMKIRKEHNLEFTDDMIAKIIKVASKVDLSKIQNSCKFPDWLGYIGLIYHLFGDIGRFNLMRELSKSYCPQFIKMVNRDSVAFKTLSEIIESDYKIDFTIDMLEQIEYGFRS